MSKYHTAEQAAALQKLTGWSRSVAALSAGFCLLGVSVGFVGTASASQLPKVSTPQVRVNTGVHVNTVNVHPVTGVNSSTVKVGNVHQLNKNNGGKGKTATAREEQLLLKLDGVEGESKDSGHKDQIEIQSFH